MANENDKIKEEEARIRSRLDKRYQEWQAFVLHAVVYITTNLVLWALWGAVNFKPVVRDMVVNATDESFVRFLSLPIPLVIMLLWAVGLVAHYVHYYIEFGPGADRHEANVQREIERYKAQVAAYEKPKNDEHSHLELNDDGEIEEVYEDLQVDKRRQG
jgi:hypothetical protein